MVAYRSPAQELKYACYPTGGHYRRHLDAFNTVTRERLYSFILYLNQGWTPNVGGKLRVYEDDGGHCKLGEHDDELPGVVPRLVLLGERPQ